MRDPKRMLTQDQIMNPPYKYLEPYREEESKAKREKNNIWSRVIFVMDWGFNGCLY